MIILPANGGGGYVVWDDQGQVRAIGSRELCEKVVSGELGLVWLQGDLFDKVDSLLSG